MYSFRSVFFSFKHYLPVKRTVPCLGTCILFLFLFQITFFLACLAWSGEHEAENRSGFTLLVQSSENRFISSSLSTSSLWYSIRALFAHCVAKGIESFHKLWFLIPIFATHLIFQTINSVRSNVLSLIYQRFTKSGCKDEGIRNFDFVAKTFT